MKEERRRGIHFFLVLSIFLGVFTLSLRGEAAPAERIRLSMGGASTGTWIYMFCATIADTWRRYIPNLDVTVLATAGSTANYLPLSKGEIDIAGGSTSADWYATHGLYFTKTKITHFCNLLLASKSFQHCFTYAESPIKSYKDLEGKRVHIGARASPGSINAEEICKSLGVKPKFVYSTPSEAIDMVKDRRVDAMIYGSGAPWSAILDIATDRKLRFIPMSPEVQN